MPEIIRIKIKNKTLRIKNCKGFSSFRGLMFDNLSDKDGALIYGNSIWMPFVRCDLDLLFLDKNFQIIDVQRAVPLSLNRETWKIYKNKHAKYCLEIKAGLERFQKGQKINFI